MKTLGANSTEIDFFKVFFTDDMMNMIVTDTNRYASQKQQQVPDKKWVPVTLIELNAWIGLRLYMSVKNLPSVAEYWSMDWMFGHLYPPNVMCRDRFDKISQYLHVADISTNPPRGQPGAKILPK